MATEHAQETKTTLVTDYARDATATGVWDGAR